jgi:hypothetical protein
MAQDSIDAQAYDSINKIPGIAGSERGRCHSNQQVFGRKHKPIEASRRYMAGYLHDSLPKDLNEPKAYAQKTLKSDNINSLPAIDYANRAHKGAPHDDKTAIVDQYEEYIQ